MARAADGQSPIDITHHLKGIDFPASRSDLVEHAKGQGASKDVLGTIEGMPEGSYETMADVMKGVGKSR
jgi:hypothetical protein